MIMNVMYPNYTITYDGFQFPLYGIMIMNVPIDSIGINIISFQFPLYGIMIMNSTQPLRVLYGWILSIPVIWDYDHEQLRTART